MEKLRQARGAEPGGAEWAGLGVRPACGARDGDLHPRCGARVRGLGIAWARAVLAVRVAPGLASVLAIHPRGLCVTWSARELTC